MRGFGCSAGLRKPAEIGQIEFWPPDKVVRVLQDYAVQRGREAGVIFDG